MQKKLKVKLKALKFYGDTCQNLFFDQKTSIYQKAVSRFSSQHHPGFNLVVLSTKSDEFYFRVFTSGLLKCNFLELSKNFKLLFPTKNPKHIFPSFTKFILHSEI
jgi:hypothetical protein